MSKIFLGLNLLALVVLGGVLLGTGRSVGEYPAPAPGNDASRVENLATLVPTPAPPLPPIADLVETTSRPLFSPGRRPPAAQRAASVAVTHVEPLEVELMAVIIAPGLRGAIVRDRKGGGVTRLAEGESHEDWTLESVTPSGVVMTQASRREHLRLRAADSPYARIGASAARGDGIDSVERLLRGDVAALLLGAAASMPEQASTDLLRAEAANVVRSGAAGVDLARTLESISVEAKKLIREHADARAKPLRLRGHRRGNL